MEFLFIVTFLIVAFLISAGYVAYRYRAEIVNFFKSMF